MPNYFIRPDMGAVIVADPFQSYERAGRQVAGAAEVVATINLPGELVGRGPNEKDGVGRLVLPAGAENGIEPGSLIVLEGLSRVSPWTQGSRGQVQSAGVTIRAERARQARHDEDLHVGLLPVRPDWAVARLTRTTKGERDAATDFPITVSLLLTYGANEDGKSRPTETLEVRVAQVLDGIRPGAAVELVDLRAGYQTVDRDDARLGIGARKSTLSLFAVAVAPVGSHSTPAPSRSRKAEAVTVPADTTPSEG